MIRFLFGTSFLAILASSLALLQNGQNNSFRKSLTFERTAALHVHDVADIVTAAANNLWLATIDADIEAIPENEFATVFAGGIGVMFGGVLSTVIVGLILDKADIYANLAAESYLEAADDEEFWKGLSEEEKVMAEAALNRIKEERGEFVPPSKSETIGSNASTTLAASSVDASGDEAPQEQSSAPKDMFSDY